MKKHSLLVAFFFVGAQCCGDHYWRDYDGRIPADAIPAGNNTDTGLSYIGQAYIHNYGLYLGTIIPGNMEISVPCYGVKKTDVIIKILCSQELSKYYWISTSSQFYANNITDRCPIIGGYDQKVKDNIGLPLGTLHIGRVNLHGSAVIGNIAYYNPGDLWFYYPVHNEEKRTQNFDLLVYTDNVLKNV